MSEVQTLTVEAAESSMINFNSSDEMDVDCLIFPFVYFGFYEKDYG